MTSAERPPVLCFSSKTPAVKSRGVRGLSKPRVLGPLTLKIWAPTALKHILGRTCKHELVAKTAGNASRFHRMYSRAYSSTHLFLCLGAGNARRFLSHPSA